MLWYRSGNSNDKSQKGSTVLDLCLQDRHVTWNKHTHTEEKSHACVVKGGDSTSIINTATTQRWQKRIYQFLKCAVYCWWEENIGGQLYYSSLLQMRFKLNTDYFLLWNKIYFFKKVVITFSIPDLTASLLWQSGRCLEAVRVNQKNKNGGIKEPNSPQRFPNYMMKLICIRVTQYVRV